MTTLETPARIEPCQLNHYPERLADVTSAITATAAALGSKLHPITARSLAGLVRVMNCYYSNLIEGHDTRPRDIERALSGELLTDERRSLQLEARAHIQVQRSIEDRFAAGTLGEPAQPGFVRWLHEEFYAHVPAELATIHDHRGSYQMQPGEFRHEPRHDNVVGRHVPPSSAAVASFMDYFSERFRLEPLGPAARLVAIAVAHHRLNYIHPFPDGNGRVSRLMSHAMALKSGIGAHGLWSISRGLARGLSERGEYKAMMDHADSPRESDLDGRGNLSLRALQEYATWFCEVMLDQLTFMEQLLELNALESRLADYVARNLRLPLAAAMLVRALLQRGDMPRGDASLVTRLPERTARELLSRLIDAGLVGSETPKGPVSLRFDSQSAEALFPRLFPAQA
ncbi:MAG: filamentation induced by cAMP protein fic [Polyangiaceae bacterium]|jgi:Fic family protein|nr:filamentation induced by cAMP protein fic [Polyangiaceae bacterium]